MRAPAFVHRGRVRARGVIVDVGLLGEAEARRRVLELLGPGTEVRELDDGAWLVLLAEPADVRATGAPGLVLTEERGRLVGAPGIELGADRVALFEAGAVRSLDPGAGRRIDPSEWIELGDVSLVRLRPLVRRAAPAALEPVATVPVDLRSEARVGERTEASRDMEASLGGAPALPGWLARLVAALAGSGSRPMAGTGDALRRPAGSGGVPRPRAPGLLDRLANRLGALLAATPLGDRVRRRHQAYVERLLRQLEEDPVEGLRHALPLGGEGGRGLASLRMPPRRTDLEIGPALTASGAAGVGPTAYQVLSLAYHRVADRLAERDRVEEAAFVLVELLGLVDKGVATLEAHGRFDLAARVAEVRGLDPSVRIRLWWKAGDRPRAIAIARRHARFADVVDRAKGDAELAHALRAAWVEALVGAGDLEGAVAAGWPDRALRPALAPLVDRGITLEGPAGAAMLAYRLALGPGDTELDETRAWLEALGPGDTELLRSFLLAFSTVRPEPAIDRELASRLQRAVMRGTWPPLDDALRGALRDLRGRADRVLAADLPSLGRRRHGGETLVAPRQPAGLVAIADAAALPSGQTLVALGERGCALLAADGHRVAHWDVPADRVILADHGNAALLVSARDTIASVTRVDLADRRPHPYGVISATRFAESYDGGLWPVVDERGIAFYDLLAERPTVAWRELEPGWGCVALARSASELSAVVAIPADGGPRVELWTWSLPGIVLRQRLEVRGRVPGASLVLLTGTSLVWTVPGEPARVGTDATGQLWGGRDRDRVLGSAASIALVGDGPDGSDLGVHRGIMASEPALRVPLGRAGAGFRAAGARVAVWDGEGRLVTADLDAPRLVTVTRLT